MWRSILLVGFRPAVLGFGMLGFGVDLGLGDVDLGVLGFGFDALGVLGLNADVMRLWCAIFL